MKNETTMNLEQILEVNEREVNIKLMPKWLAELEIIEKLIERKKDIRKKIELAMETIGEYNCDIYSIYKKTKVEEKMIDSKDTPTILADTFEQLKQVALKNNDTNLLEDIKKAETDFENDKKVSYAKPANKIKTMKALYEKCKNICNKDIKNDNLIQTNVIERLELKQHKFLNFEEDFEDKILEAQDLKYVS